MDTFKLLIKVQSEIPPVRQFLNFLFLEIQSQKIDVYGLPNKGVKLLLKKSRM